MAFYKKIGNGSAVIVSRHREIFGAMKVLDL